MPYVRNKYIRATIILWNLKGWLETPQNSARHGCCSRLSQIFPTRLPRLDIASYLCSDRLYVLPWALVLFPGIPKHAGDALSRLVLFSQPTVRNRRHLPLHLSWDEASCLLAFILSLRKANAPFVPKKLRLNAQKTAYISDQGSTY